MKKKRSDEEVDHLADRDAIVAGVLFTLSFLFFAAGVVVGPSGGFFEDIEPRATLSGWLGGAKEAPKPSVRGFHDYFQEYTTPTGEVRLRLRGATLELHSWRLTGSRVRLDAGDTPGDDISRYREVRSPQEPFVLYDSGRLQATSRVLGLDP